MTNKYIVSCYSYNSVNIDYLKYTYRAKAHNATETFLCSLYEGIKAPIAEIITKIKEEYLKHPTPSMDILLAIDDIYVIASYMRTVDYSDVEYVFDTFARFCITQLQDLDCQINLRFLIHGINATRDVFGKIKEYNPDYEEDNDDDEDDTYSTWRINIPILDIKSKTSKFSIRTEDIMILNCEYLILHCDALYYDPEKFEWNRNNLPTETSPTLDNILPCHITTNHTINCKFHLPNGTITIDEKDDDKDEDVYKLGITDYFYARERYNSSVFRKKYANQYYYPHLAELELNNEVGDVVYAKNKYKSYKLTTDRPIHIKFHSQDDFALLLDSPADCATAYTSDGKKAELTFKTLTMEELTITSETIESLLTFEKPHSPLYLEVHWHHDEDSMSDSITFSLNINPDSLVIEDSLLSTFLMPAITMPIKYLVAHQLTEYHNAKISNLNTIFDSKYLNKPFYVDIALNIYAFIGLDMYETHVIGRLGNVFGYSKFHEIENIINKDFGGIAPIPNYSYIISFDCDKLKGEQLDMSIRYINEFIQSLTVRVDADYDSYYERDSILEDLHSMSYTKKLLTWLNIEIKNISHECYTMALPSNASFYKWLIFRNCSNIHLERNYNDMYLKVGGLNIGVINSMITVPLFYSGTFESYIELVKSLEINKGCEQHCKNLMESQFMPFTESDVIHDDISSHKERKKAPDFVFYSINSKASIDFVQDIVTIDKDHNSLLIGYAEYLNFNGLDKCTEEMLSEVSHWFTDLDSSRILPKPNSFSSISKLGSALQLEFGQTPVDEVLGFN